MRFVPIELPATGEGRTFAYLIPAARPVLVDCGPPTDAAWHALTDGLAQHGLEPADLARVVLTHGHPGHAGQAARLSREADVEVVAHAHTAALLDAGDDERARTRENTRRFLRSRGCPPELADALAAPPEPRTPRVRVDREVEHGDELAIDDDALTCFLSEGHVAGHLVLWHGPTATLLCGDQLLAGGRTVPMMSLAAWHRGLRTSALNLYLNGLRHLAKVPAEHLLSGHGPLAEDLETLVGRIGRRHVLVRRRIVAHLAERPASAWELTCALFRDVAHRRPWDALCWTVGNLDYLDRGGDVVEDEAPDDGVATYRLARPRVRGPAPPRLSVDGDGRWFEDGHAITHPRTVAMLIAGLGRGDDGHHHVTSGGQQVPVAVADAPVVVHDVDRADGRLVARLRYDGEAELRFDSLAVGPGDALYGTLTNGLEARFGRAAQVELARWVVPSEAPGGFDVDDGAGGRHPIGLRPARAKPQTIA